MKDAARSRRPQACPMPTCTLLSYHRVKLFVIPPLIPRFIQLLLGEHSPNDLQHLASHSHNRLLTTPPQLHPLVELAKPRLTCKCVTSHFGISSTSTPVTAPTKRASSATTLFPRRMFTFAVSFTSHLLYFRKVSFIAFSSSRISESRS